MNNSFVQQFSPNIKFKYNCFDRVILRGYIRWLFFPAGVVKFFFRDWASPAGGLSPPASRLLSGARIPAFAGMT